MRKYQRFKRNVTCLCLLRFNLYVFKIWGASKREQFHRNCDSCFIAIWTVNRITTTRSICWIWPIWKLKNKKWKCLADLLFLTAIRCLAVASGAFGVRPAFLILTLLVLLPSYSEGKFHFVQKVGIHNWCLKGKFRK